MIKVDQLRDFRPTIRYTQGGEDITLFNIQAAIKDAAMQMGIPVAFNSDRVKSGGLFNSNIEDCIVVYHSKHANDYFKFAIRIQRQGTVAFVAVNDFGVSKQMQKANLSEIYKSDRKGKQMSYKVGSLVGQGIRTLGKSKQKLEEERNYYAVLSDIFDQLIS